MNFLFQAINRKKRLPSDLDTRAPYVGGAFRPST